MSSSAQNNPETDECILFEERNGTNLIISFGGGGKGMLAAPVFEFFNSLNQFDCDKLFLRDLNQAWYQKGVDENINTISKLADFIRTKTLAKKYKKVILIGSSLGGYAAILFGTMLNVNTVIAFAPQSFIDKWRRFIYRDKRWLNPVKGVYNNPKKEKKYFDLKVFLKTLEYDTEILVYYGSIHRLDSLHAKRLSEIKNIKLIPVEEGGHGVVKTMRDSGELYEIIKTVLTN
jgi:hypothetical protein